jgi:Skp family chaperone for outer membrane proteins
LNSIKTVAMLGLLVLGSFLLNQPASAQTTSPPTTQSFQANVAILNLNAFRHNAAVLKDIQAQVAEYQNALRENLQKEEEDLRVLQLELNKKQSILSAETYNEERRAFEQKVVKYRRSVQERKRALDRSRLKAMAKVEEMLRIVVQEIAETKDITLVLRQEQTVFSSPKMAITAEVLEQVNTRLPSLKVEKPGQ